jgi:hypothetical protein
MGSKRLWLLNQETHSKVASSTDSLVFQGPRRWMNDLPPINHLQSVRIKLLTIGEINEDPKTAVHLGI